MRHPTNYRTLRNRCPNCGHRLSMVKDGHGDISKATCVVINGEGMKSPVEYPCACIHHSRKN